MFRQRVDRVTPPCAQPLQQTDPPMLDIAANRQATKYSKGEMYRRLLWGFGRWLFRLSPRPCFGWRRCILRCFGAKVGNEVNIYSSALIYFPWNLSIGNWSSIGEWALVYNLGPVTIGEKVTVSQGAHICAGTHDYRQTDMPLLKPPIEIKDQVWICADAFVGPGVTVGEGAVIGARAVVTRNVEPWTIIAGNPAREIKKRRVIETPSASKNS
jgi:putative colanic acid biosynthesis acetyltransferase WcaF